MYLKAIRENYCFAKDLSFNYQKMQRGEEETYAIEYILCDEQK